MHLFSEITKLNTIDYLWTPFGYISIIKENPDAIIKIDKKALGYINVLKRLYENIYQAKGLKDDNEIRNIFYNYNVKLTIDKNPTVVKLHALDLKNAYYYVLLELMDNATFRRYFNKTVAVIKNKNRKVKAKTIKQILVGILTKSTHVFTTDLHTIEISTKYPLFKKISNLCYEKLKRFVEEYELKDYTVAFYVDCIYITEEGLKKLQGKEKEIYRKYKIRLKEEIEFHITPYEVYLRKDGIFMRDRLKNFENIKMEEKDPFLQKGIIPFYKNLPYAWEGIERKITQKGELLRKFIKPEEYTKVYNTMGEITRKVYRMVNNGEIFKNPQTFRNFIVNNLEFISYGELVKNILPDIYLTIRDIQKILEKRINISREEREELIKKAETLANIYKEIENLKGKVKIIDEDEKIYKNTLFKKENLKEKFWILNLKEGENQYIKMDWYTF